MLVSLCTRQPNSAFGFFLFRALSEVAKAYTFGEYFNEFATIETELNLTDQERSVLQEISRRTGKTEGGEMS